MLPGSIDTPDCRHIQIPANKDLAEASLGEGVLVSLAVLAITSLRALPGVGSIQTAVLTISDLIFQSCSKIIKTFAKTKY